MSEQPEKQTPETTPPPTPATHDLEGQIRATIGKWVGAKPEDDWETIGRLMEANFRGRMAEMVGAKPAEGQSEATWDEIGARLESRMRQLIGGWAGASPEDDWDTVGKKMGEKAETMGARIEADVRKGIGSWVGAAPDADWDTIGNLLGEKFRRLFGGAREEAESAAQPEKKTQVPISGGDETEEPKA